MKGYEAIAQTFCCSCLGRIFNVLSVILGLAVLACSIPLFIASQTANPAIMYYIAAILCLVGGLYISLRTFSLARSIAQLDRVNRDLQETHADLENTNSHLQDRNAELLERNVELVESIEDFRTENLNLSREVTELDNSNSVYAEQLTEQKGIMSKMKALNDSLESQNAFLEEGVDKFQKMNLVLEESVDHLHIQLDSSKEAVRESLRLQDQQRELLEQSESEISKLRSAITALAVANEKTMDVGKLIGDLMRDIELQRDQLTTERELQEKFTVGLSKVVFQEMDANGDGNVSTQEQKDWLDRMRRE